MSLNELRAEAEKPEEDVTEEAVETEEETLEEVDTEEEASEPVEPSEDFELELDGESEPDQQKTPDAEQALINKLTAKHHKYKEARDKASVLEERVKELEARLSGEAKPEQRQAAQADIDLPTFPDMYDKGIDGDRAKYDQAIKAWWKQAKAAEQAQTQKSQQSDQQRQKLEEKSLSLAKKAAQFTRENNVSPDRVIAAIERAKEEVDAATKVDGALVHLLDSVGDGSERVAYYIGTNDGAMAKIKELLAQDPSGFKAVTQMTRWTALKPKHSSRTSKAPAPDEPLRGDGSPASAKQLQDKFDKASDKRDFKTMKALTSKARELGIRLN